MARHESREAATPVVMGEQLDPPKYGELWSEAASRVFFASYREYEQRVKFANAEGVVRRQLMGVSQLIPVYVQRCFAQHYYQRQILTAEELLNGSRSSGIICCNLQQRPNSSSELLQQSSENYLDIVASARRSGQQDFQRRTPPVSLASRSISPFLSACIITE